MLEFCSHLKNMGDPCMLQKERCSWLLYKRMTEVCHASLKWKTWGALHYFLGVKLSTVVHWEHFEAIRYARLRTPVDTSTKLVKAKDEDTFVVSCGKSVCCHKAGNVAKFCAKANKATLDCCELDCCETNLSVSERDSEVWSPLQDKLRLVVVTWMFGCLT